MEFSARLYNIFFELNQRILALDEERRQLSGLKIARAEVELLGQMSLMSNQDLSHRIALAETADMDAHLRTEYVVEKELKAILRNHGLVYDDSSNEIWIPPNTVFEPLYDFERVSVTRIDSESALVSKAVKAPEKNRLLIQSAIATDVFPNLLERIEKNGGNIDYFLEDET